MNYPVLIKQLRTKLMLTQTEFAELLSISFESVNRYENDKSNPTMKVKRKLQKLFVENGISEEKYE